MSEKESKTATNPSIEEEKKKRKKEKKAKASEGENDHTENVSSKKEADEKHKEKKEKSKKESTSHDTKDDTKKSKKSSSTAEKPSEKKEKSSSSDDKPKKEENPEKKTKKSTEKDNDAEDGKSDASPKKEKRQLKILNPLVWVPLDKSKAAPQPDATPAPEVSPEFDPLLNTQHVARSSTPAQDAASSHHHNDNAELVIENPLFASENANPLTSEKVDPLAGEKVTAADPLGAVSDDPLGAGNLKVAAPSVSPLVKAMQQQESQADAYDECEDDFFPWASMKPQILHEFTTDERVKITVSFIDNPLAVGLQQSAKDKKQQRLEELERSAAAASGGHHGREREEELSVTQKEYTKHIENMHAEMVRAWESEDRVKTLKVVIQAVKLLSDTSVPKFYPSKFVMITEILDTFGDFVYERIKKRRTILHPQTHKPLPDKDIPKSVIEQAIETCRNWFYKIASIRELMPRIYVELAMIRCHSFLEAAPKFASIIEGLSWQIRGIADPLVQAYAYCYLTRRAHALLPYDKQYYLRCFHDTLEHQRALGPQRLERIRSKLGISAADYARLFGPAIEWLLHCISHKSDVKILDETVSYYKEISNNPIYLDLIISSFPPDFITGMAPTLVKLIRDSDPTLFPHYKLYRTLGVNLALKPPPFGDELVILREVWSVVTKIDVIENYMTVADIFVEYTLKHCKPAQVNAMLADILAHLKKDAESNEKKKEGGGEEEQKAKEKEKDPVEIVSEDQNSNSNVQALVVSIIQKIVSIYTSFNTIFSLSHFVELLDVLDSSHMITASKIIMEGFSRTKELISDPFIINTLLNVATTLHDTINALSLSDDVRIAARTISAFVTKIDFGKEVEKQLNFYADCRQCFPNLDPVRSQLVSLVSHLAMRTFEIVKGRHTTKTSAFVRACISFCFITIPTIDDVFVRLDAYLTAAEVALINRSVAQADGFFRSAITAIQDIPLVDAAPADAATEERLLPFIRNFLAALILVPGHPELGPFYLYEGLLKVLADYPWCPASHVRGDALLAVLASLAAMAQPSLPYHSAPTVEANDALYKGDPHYMPDLQKVIADTIEMIIDYQDDLKAAGEAQNAQAVQAKFSIDFFNCIVQNYTINPQVGTLAYNAAKAAKQLLAVVEDIEGNLKRYVDNSVAWLGQNQGKLEQDIYKKLLE